ALNTRTCQRWFKKFKNDDFNPFAGIKSGRPVADPKQTIQELATKLKTSRSTIQWCLKQLNKLQREGMWLPHKLSHDNARSHSVRITQEKIKELNWKVLAHPPYSPDAAPSDYHHFYGTFFSWKRISYSGSYQNCIRKIFYFKITKKSLKRLFY
ncbi:Histone-lysine N-methyltransferase SETMAR, partial [Melipona quadrifasciata]